jgi:hypothetical protein
MAVPGAHSGGAASALVTASPRCSSKPCRRAKWRVGQPDYVGGHHLDGGLLLAVGGELRRVGGDPFSRVEQSTLNQHGDDGGGSASAARGDHHQAVAGHRALVDDVDPSPEVDDLRTAAKDGARSGLFARFFEGPPERISNRTEPLADTSLDTRHFPRISPLSDERPRTESEQEGALVPHPRPARGDGRRPGTLRPRDLRRRRRDGRRVLSRSPCPGRCRRRGWGSSSASPYCSTLLCG